MRGKPKLIKYADKYGNLKSPNWYIQSYEGGRSQRISTGFAIGTQDEEAQLAFAKFIVDGTIPLNKPTAEWLVSEILTLYYEEHAQYLKSAKQAKNHERTMLSAFGDYFVGQMKQKYVSDFIRASNDMGRSSGTVRRELAHLNAAFNYSVREGRLLYAPKFKMPPPPPPRDRVLNTTEIEQLFIACTTEHVHSFVTLMLNTGQRPGAIEGLKWEQVDFENRIIRFDKDGKQQSKKLARPVPMNEIVFDLLTSLYAKAVTDYVLEYKGQPAGCVKRAFSKACIKAGLKGVSRYTLRHTYGTYLYTQGVSEKVIADMMGHTSAKTTSQHYIKHDMDRLRVTVDSFGISAQKVRKSDNSENGYSSLTEEGSGAAYRIRTYDPIITNDVLYQLS